MRMVNAGLALVSVFCLVPAAYSATPSDDFVAADTFIAACDKAKATTDAAQLRTLLANAQSLKPRAEKQRAAADADATGAVTALEDTALQQGLKMDEEIAGLRRRIAAAEAEQTRLYEVATREGSGPLFESAFRERAAKMEEVKALQAEVAAAQALQGRLAAGLAQVQGASGNLARADAVISIVNDLGVRATLSFAGPMAGWAAAKLILTGADATLEAAEEAVDCIGKKLAAVEDARAAEAKYLRDNLIRLGKAMQAKQAELKQAEKTATAVIGRLFSGATDAQINAAVNNYLKVSDEFVAMGVEFHTEVNRLAAKGIAVEPWMTQVITAYTEAKKVADQARAKKKR